MIGVSIGQLLTGTIPDPRHKLNWGEDIPPHIMEALRSGETAMLYDEDGNEHSIILMDTYGQLREKMVGRC